MEINKALIDELLAKAADSPRLRANFDMRTSPEDGSQRMLNALMPGTVVAVHRHPHSTESVICLCGKLDEVFYEVAPDGGGLREIGRERLEPAAGSFGCIVPEGVWHTVEVLEPSVIFEAKDGAYGCDGSENY